MNSNEAAEEIIKCLNIIASKIQQSEYNDLVYILDKFQDQYTTKMQSVIINRFKNAGVFGKSGEEFNFTKAIKAIRDFYVRGDSMFDTTTKFLKREDDFRNMLRGL